MSKKRKRGAGKVRWQPGVVAGYRTIGNPRPAWWKGDTGDVALALMLMVRDERAKSDRGRGLGHTMCLRQICDSTDELIEQGYTQFVQFPDGSMGIELTDKALTGDSSHEHEQVQS